MSEAPLSIDAALIDLDGTLVHSLPDLATAANRLLHDLGQPAMPAHTLGNFVGKGSRDMVKRMLNACQLAGNTGSEEAELDDLVERFFRHYREVNGQQSEVYPGVIEGLQAFRLAGVKLAVVTNKALEFSQQLLRQTGLTPYFDLIVAGDTCARKKPHPDPLLHACQQLNVAPWRALMIGDSINDVQAARAAGVRVVLVPYGYHHGADIHRFDVDGIVSCIEDAVHWAASSQQDNTTPS